MSMSETLSAPEKIDWKNLLEPVVNPVTGVVSYEPLLRVEPDPATSVGESGGTSSASSNGGGADNSQAIEITLPDGTKETIDNPAGLYTAYNKYKGLGSVDQLDRQLKEYHRATTLLDSIQRQGVQPSDIPELLQKMKEEDESQEKQKAEMARQVDTQIAALKTEHQRALDDLTALANSERAQRVQVLEDFFVESQFAANAKDEFRREFSTWWGPMRDYVEFEQREDPTQPVRVARIKKPDGSILLAENAKGETHEAGLNDFFDAIVEGKYGVMAKAALRPFTAASGGGRLSPAATDMSGKLRISANFNYGGATPEQLAQIKAGNYIVAN